MYRNVAQWSDIRDRVLNNEISIHRVAREVGISRVTVRKMLKYPAPQAYASGDRRRSKLGPHTASIQRLLHENTLVPRLARISVRGVYERIRNDEGFTGTYRTVQRYVRSNGLSLG